MAAASSPDEPPHLDIIVAADYHGDGSIAASLLYPAEPKTGCGRRITLATLQQECSDFDGQIYRAASPDDVRGTASWKELGRQLLRLKKHAGDWRVEA